MKTIFSGVNTTMRNETVLLTKGTLMDGTG